MAHVTPLRRGLVAALCVVPLLFFSYFTLVDRWEAGDRALGHLAPGPRIVVGVSLQRGSEGQTEQRSQVYIALPASLRSLDAYGVVQDDRGVRVRPIRFGLVIFVGFYCLWIVVAARFLVGRTEP